MTYQEWGGSSYSCAKQRSSYSYFHKDFVEATIQNCKKMFGMMKSET
jgi:hypothetical protein